MNENTEKIIEPKMRFDAFMANVKDGGLRSVSSIYMLVCYIVANLNGRVSASTIIEAVDGAMIANYFEISDAVAKLIKAVLLQASPCFHSQRVTQTTTLRYFTETVQVLLPSPQRQRKSFLQSTQCLLMLT